MKSYLLPAALGLALLGGVAGCANPVVARKAQIETFTHDGVLAMWNTLTDSQKRNAYKASRDAWWAVRYHLTGDPLPEDLRPRTRPRIEELMPDERSHWGGR